MNEIRNNFFFFFSIQPVEVRCAFFANKLMLRTIGKLVQKWKILENRYFGWTIHTLSYFKTITVVLN